MKTKKITRVLVTIIERKAIKIIIVEVKNPRHRSKQQFTVN